LAIFLIYWQIDLIAFANHSAVIREALDNNEPKVHYDGDNDDDDDDPSLTNSLQ